MKKCFKCQNEKPLEEFYRHPQMKDGRLNKCKDCTKADVERDRMKKLNDPEWVEKELARQRKKSAQYRAEGRASKLKQESQLAWDKRNQQKRRAHRIVFRALRNGELKRSVCTVCGCAEAEAHHEDYARPLDVTWLCPTHHGQRHVEINRERRLKLTK